MRLLQELLVKQTFKQFRMKLLQGASCYNGADARTAGDATEPSTAIATRCCRYFGWGYCKELLVTQQGYFADFRWKLLQRQLTITFRGCWMLR
jgi:hypothetical protein